MRIGIIGLGLLGRAIARRLLDAGYAVLGYDLNEAACEEAALLGVTIHGTAQEAADDNQWLLLCLMTSEDRRRLLWGDQAVAGNLKSGTTILDTTTARPDDIVEDHARLKKQGVRLIDVCISGSSQSVLDHKALALVGDTKYNAGSFADILAAFSKSQFYFDSPGRANEAKLIVNTVMGLNRLVLAEALGLATKSGFDLGQILDVLKQGDTYSTVMDTKGPKMASGVYEPATARLEQHAKDVNLILDYAHANNADMPVSRLHKKLLQQAIDKGVGPLDNAAIFSIYE